MWFKTSIDKLTCIDINLCKNETIRKLLFENPLGNIYVTDSGRFYGLITLGDYRRNFPNITAAINRTSKTLVEDNRFDEKAEEIFSNKKIKRVPVLDSKGTILYEISCENSQEMKDEKVILDTQWMNYCITHYKRILLIDAEGIADKIVKQKEVKVVKSCSFDFTALEQYDLIVDLDINKYKARRRLLIREYKAHIYKYTNPDDILFQISLNNFFEKAKQNNIAIQIYETPSADKLEFLSEEQMERVHSPNFWHYYFKDREKYEMEIKEIFDISDYDSYINSLYDLPLPIRKKGTISYEDYRSSFCNIVDGYRITENKRYENYSNKVELYGPCIVFGLFVNDKRTITSYLQEKINESKINHYDVHNMGIRGGSLRESIEIIKGRVYRSGDVIIFILPTEEIEYLKRCNLDIEVVELSGYFNEKRNVVGTFFLDKPIHCNHKANQLISEILFERIQEDYTHFDTSYANEVYLGEPQQKNNLNTEGLLQYVEELRQTVDCNEDDVVGSIVMNCNPFTKGHEYLVQYASSMVDVLVVFVVEENKSFFPFEDRIQLVRKGCEKLKNVIVVPSGKYIISSITFPEYFVKEKLADSAVQLDMSVDLDIFAEYIAKGVGIQYRFVGEEPIDVVTRQYNESMKRKLSKAGIQVVEIPRKESQDGLVISASRVRKYLKEKDWESIKRLVPETTLEYLKSEFS